MSADAPVETIPLGTPIIDPEIVTPVLPVDRAETVKSIMDRFKNTSGEQPKVSIYRLVNYDVDRRTDSAALRAFIRTVPLAEDLEEIVQRECGPGAYSLDFRDKKVINRGFLLVDASEYEGGEDEQLATQPVFNSNFKHVAETVVEFGKVYKDLNTALTFNQQQTQPKQNFQSAAPADPLTTFAERLKEIEDIKTLLGVDTKTPAGGTTANGKTMWDVLGDAVTYAGEAAMAYFAKPGLTSPIAPANNPTPEPIRAMQTPQQTPPPAQPQFSLANLMQQVIDRIKAGAAPAEIAGILNGITDPQLKSQLQMFKNVPVIMLKAYLSSYPGFQDFLSQGQTAVTFLADVQRQIA
jgi:hypothetical protein